MKEYIIDTIGNNEYFIITKSEKEVFKINKAVNTLESVIKLVGKENIKEVITSEIK